MKNILALIDFSELTAQVVLKAGELSSFYKAKCWLMHVAAPEPDFVGYDVGPKYIRDHRAGELKEEHHRLAEYKEYLEGEGVEVEALLIQGQTNSTILSEVKKLNIDMVVLGSHGHSRIHDLLVGSVCEYVLRNVSVPILVIPDREEE